MANRTNHWTKYIIDGVDYRDICKHNNISETCFYSRVCTLGIPPEYACKIPSVKDRQPLLEIVRLMKENEAMREEFEVLHGNHKCVLEDKERLQKAVNTALISIGTAAILDGEDAKKYADAKIDLIKQLIKGE